MAADGRQPDGQNPGRARPTALRVSACAKVNLSLEVLGRRPDGFHEIVSVTQLISLADTVEVAPGDELSIDMHPPLVATEENLAWRAAHALAAQTGQSPAAALRIAKRIPLAAGLGGGSSDAAATLRLLDRVWDTRLGARRLAQLAATLGSDVPLFLRNGSNLIRGRGEIVEPLDPLPPFGLLLVYPGGAPADKTRALYGALTRSDFTDGASTLALADRLRSGAAIEGLRLVNGFDAAASRVYPGFAELRAELARLLGRPVHLSGAGPTLFALYDVPQDARSAAAKVRRPDLVTIVARSIAHRPRIHIVRPR